MVAGLALQAIAIGWLAVDLRPGRRVRSLIAPFVIAGTGMALVFAPSANAVLRSVRPEEAGQASGATNAIRELGGVMGVAVLAAVFAANGSYASPQAFSDGVVAALPVGAVVLAVGALRRAASCPGASGCRWRCPLPRRRARSTGLQSGAVMLRQGITALAVLLTLVAPAAARAADDPVTTVAGERVARYVPKQAGTEEQLRVWFGPYVVAPGHDANRFDLELPMRDGFVTTVEPGMRRVEDLSEPGHQEAHIHHAHWFALDPGNEEDNYSGGQHAVGLRQRRRGDARGLAERTAAEPGRADLRRLHARTQPQADDLHAAQQDEPAAARLHRAGHHVRARDAEGARAGRYHLDVTGVLFGRTYDVPRKPTGDGTTRRARRGDRVDLHDGRAR